MEVGYGIFRIAELSVYASHDTPEQKLTMEMSCMEVKLTNAELPHQVLPEGFVMTDEVLPADMSPQDMERRKQSMMLTGSVFRKFEPL